MGILNETGSGAGDVSGPAGSTDGNLAAFSGSDGKQLQDAGFAVEGTLSGAANAVPSSEAIENWGLAQTAIPDLPDIAPTLLLAFAEAKSLDPIVNFSRASSGTYFDATGMLRTAEADEPRFDHDPETGECKGLLIEEQRTNLVQHNRDLTQSGVWSGGSNITAAKDQTGIDGTSNSASKITASAADGTILQPITSASAARATSAYVKRITGTGTVSMTQDGGTAWTEITVTDAWTRVELASATITNPSVGFKIATSGDAIAVDYVQCETGAFSTSAILTTTASATRSADVANVALSDFDYNYKEGSLVLECTCYGKEAVYSYFLGISNGTTDNSIGIGWVQDDSFRVYMEAENTSNVSEAVSGHITAGDSFKAGLSFKDDDVAGFMDGALVVQDNACTVPESVNILSFYGINNTGANMITVHISKFTYYTRALSDSDMQALTEA